jgi:NitT/TauT family transport system substrate-binding protein
MVMDEDPQRRSTEMRRKLFTRVVPWLAAVVMVAACGGGDGEPAETTTTAAPDTTAASEEPGDTTTTTEGVEELETAEFVYGQFGWHADHWPVYIAQEEGLFDAPDVMLDVEQIVPGDARQFLPALLSGDMHIAVGGQLPFILQRMEGAETVAVFSFRNTPSHRLIGTVPTLEEVEGGLVGVSAEVSADGALTELVLESVGLTLGEDYDFIVVGGTTDRAAALQSGGIVAGLIGQPVDFNLLEQEGLYDLGTTADYVTDFLWQGGQVTEEYAAENGEVLVRFLRAILRATDWFYDEANREAAIEYLITYTESEREAAELTYDLFHEVRAFPEDLRPTVASYENLLIVLEQGGELEGREAPTPEEFFNFTFLDEAVATK